MVSKSSQTRLRSGWIILRPLYVPWHCAYCLLSQRPDVVPERTLVSYIFKLFLPILRHGDRSCHYFFNHVDLHLVALTECSEIIKHNALHVLLVNHALFVELSLEIRCAPWCLLFHFLFHHYLRPVHAGRRRGRSQTRREYFITGRAAVHFLFFLFKWRDMNSELHYFFLLGGQ